MKSLWLARMGFLVGLAAFAPPAAGQGMAGWGEVSAGSGLEDYLRVLQVAGVTGPHPWSVRGFSPGEIAGLVPVDSVEHPWRDHWAFRAGRDGGVRMLLVRPQVEGIYNSALPNGGNDSAVWAGRGLTGTVRVGFTAQAGPVSVQVAPVAFYAANASFDLIDNGQQGSLVYADGYNPRRIDLPQRFGDEPYHRIDPGQTTIRADVRGLSIGVSTANQLWGPAIDLPLLLGANAPGFLHAFVGTAEPVGVGIGALQGRVFWGRLDQSEYSAYPGDDRRFATGVVGVFTPRWVPGLEVGAGRFFHNSWPAGGISPGDLLQPFGAVLKQVTLAPGDTLGAEPGGGGNQLASAFFRWVFAGSGVEVFGEFLREDHSYDVRDLILEPDHIRGRSLGLRKVWRAAPDRFYSLRVEALDGRRSHLARVRGQSQLYTHSQLVQGHTQRGQTLGSPAVYGGAGSMVAFESYAPAGRWALSWDRRQVGESARAATATGADLLDVVHALGGEATWFRGRFDLDIGAAAVYEVNRGALRDPFSVRGSFGVRAHL